MIASSARLLASIEAFQHHRARSGPWHSLMRKVARARHSFWSFITHSDIEPRATLGRRLMLPHPNGVVIHEDAIVGNDCMMPLAKAGAWEAEARPKCQLRVSIDATLNTTTISVR